MPTVLQFFNGLVANMQNILLANGGIFVATGVWEFRILATIAISFLGMRWGFAQWSISEGFSRFVDLMILIGIGFTICNYYVAPIPGVGVSFVHLVLDKTQNLAQQIGYAQAENIAQRLGVFQGNIEVPHAWNILGDLCYGVVILEIWLLQAFAFIEVAYGLCATTVVALVGPVFVPFFIAGPLDFLFWSWLKCFLQFAMYNVIASAVIYIAGNALILPVGAVSTLTLVEWMPQAFVILACCIYMITRIPAITNALFSGSSSGGLGSAVAGGVIGRIL
jgi:TrbL/VirB6 plasmid conjugal transfer protein